jgi:spermidine/putrescine-binding protein
VRLAIVLPVLLLVNISCGRGPGDRRDAATTVPDTSDEAVVCELDEVDGDLFLYNRIDYIDPDLVSDFEMEFEVEVLTDTYDSDEALLTKLQSGAVYDLVVPSNDMIATMIEQGLLARVQTSAVPNVGNLMPTFRNPSYDPDGAYSVAYQWGTTGLTVDTSLTGDGLEPSWSLVFDAAIVSQYPSGVAIIEDAREVMGAALKYLGYSLNSTRESELQEAADVIAGVSEYISMLPEDDSAGALLDDGVTVSHLRAKPSLTDNSDQAEGARFVNVVPKEGASLWVDSMAITANAEHPCTAHAFINFILEPEHGAALSNWTRLASPNRASEEFILPEIFEDQAIYPPEDIRERLEIISDLGEFENEYDDYFAIARS